MRSWCNGQLLPTDAVRIDPSDRGFTLGDGVFETVRILGGAAVRTGDHLARLRHGANLLGIPVAYTDQALADALAAVAAANGVRDGAARITLSRGPAPRGLATPAVVAPTLLVAAYPMQPRTGPVRLITARSTCRNERSPLSRIKSLNYLDGIIARREAEACGLDDAILLNTTGGVAECTAATVLVLAEDRLWTPPVSDGALPGTARKVLLAAGLVEERSIDPVRLSGADALFVCNSLGIQPVASLDGRTFTETSSLLRRLAETLARTPDRSCPPGTAC